MKEIETISAIYSNVRKFPVKGKLSFALENTTTDEITVSYVDDNAATPESKAAFKSQPVEDFQIRGLVRISKSLIGKSQFDLRTYVIQKIASAYAKFIENEIFNGTKAAGKIQGLVTLPSDRTVDVPLADADLSIDYLMDLESKVPT
ncbi:MAG: phage major capsid protein, partial [Niameybacter sp.]